MKKLKDIFTRKKVSNENIISKANMAYYTLLRALEQKKITKNELTAAMQEAVGYLGEVLE